MNRPLSFLLFLILLAPFSSSAAETVPDIVIKGRITSLAGEPAPDAEVYLYATTNSRRPADFISPKADNSGAYRMVVPKKAYWAVARVKKGGRYGPLMPGDRHSGEPTAINPEGETELTIDFTVADMQELAQKRQKWREELVEITGVVTGADGAGLPDSYVFARTGQQRATLPEFFSGWTDETGKYRLKLPPGRYFLGIGRTFPPDTEKLPLHEIEVSAAQLPVAIDLQIPVE
jgi:hypothetical protein